MDWVYLLHKNIFFKVHLKMGSNIMEINPMLKELTQVKW